MSNNSILKKNEYEAGRFAALVMLLTIIFIGLVYVLELLNIFIVPLPVITVALSVGTAFLLIPFILVNVLKLRHPAVKYVIVTAAALMVATLNLFLSYHVVLLFVYPIAIASLFFSRALSWYTVIISVVLSSLSQIFGFNAGGVEDRNMENLTNAIMYGVAPRAIELIAISLIFIMLSKRTKGMLQNVMGAEEQKTMLDRMKAVTDKSIEVAGVLSDSVGQLSVITTQTTAANEQIADNTSRIAAGSEDTMKFTDEAAGLVDNMAARLNDIADESRNMAEISKQLMLTNESSGKIIKKAVDEMEEIAAAAEESRRIIGVLEERSSEIGRIVEVIAGISQQTNLLALNAAIESARAGEQGKGFAVVSDEIRKLAEQSQKASKDIANLIKAVLEDTGRTVESMDKSTAMVEKGLNSINEAGSSFEKIFASGSQMNDKVQEVNRITVSAADNGKNMASIVHKIRDINRNNLEELNNIAASCQEQVASMQQVAAAVDTIERISDELVSTVK